MDLQEALVQLTDLRKEQANYRELVSTTDGIENEKATKRKCAVEREIGTLQRNLYKILSSIFVDQDTPVIEPYFSSIYGPTVPTPVGFTASSKDAYKKPRIFNAFEKDFTYWNNLFSFCVHCTFYFNTITKKKSLANGGIFEYQLPAVYSLKFSVTIPGFKRAFHFTKSLADTIYMDCFPAKAPSYRFILNLQNGEAINAYKDFLLQYVGPSRLQNLPSLKDLVDTPKNFRLSTTNSCFITFTKSKSTKSSKVVVNSTTTLYPAKEISYELVISSYVHFPNRKNQLLSTCTLLWYDVSI